MERALPYSIFDKEQLLVLIAQFLRRIEKLRRQIIYCAWNCEGILVYAGQSTDFWHRLYRHLMEALKDGNKSPWHEKLADYLKTGGLYFAPILKDLDDLEANDLEFFAIKCIKQNTDKKAAGNKNNARISERISSMIQEEREAEQNSIADEIKDAFNGKENSKDFLFVNSRNVEEITKTLLQQAGATPMKCMNCQRNLKTAGGFCSGCRTIMAFKFDGQCKRCDHVFGPEDDFPKLGKDDKCKVCYDKSNDCKRAGRIQQAYNPMRTGRFAITDNVPLHLLACSAYNDGIGKCKAETLINQMLCDGLANASTIQGWNNQKFDQGPTVYKEFLQLKAVSEFSIDCLIVYELSKKPKPTVIQALNRINTLFAPFFVSEIRIHEVNDNFDSVKEELKRAVLEKYGPKIAAKVKYIEENCETE